MLVENVKYGKIFEFFEEISAVPRGSGKTDKIADYCVNFAKSRNLEYIRDSSNNVIIFKGGSAGRENEPAVILQGHTDMVWEKADGVDFDFENDGLKLHVDGDMLYAEGTTLGGDDGIAVAMCFAILDDDSLSHPPLEVVLTVDEEIGMLGVRALDTSVLKGKTLINLDSEQENILWVSCAGGARANIELPVTRIKNNRSAYKFTFTGFEGGHSGTEIDKGHANASVEAGKYLKELSKKENILVSSITGGKMDNAITREASFTVCCDNDVSEYASEFENRIRSAYPNEIKAFVKCEKVSADYSFDISSTQNVITLFDGLPYGVTAMSKEIDGLVQTSLNPGVLYTENDKVVLGYSCRSSVNAEKEELLSLLEKRAKSVGASINFYGCYSAWEYRKQSPLRDTMTRVYRELYGKELNVTAVHAGLECGIFCEKILGLDCVSLGPDIFDIHTPKERLSISSTERIYEFVIQTLK